MVSTTNGCIQSAYKKIPNLIAINPIPHWEVYMTPLIYGVNQNKQTEIYALLSDNSI